jgi:hypothetical protein
MSGRGTDVQGREIAEVSGRSESSKLARVAICGDAGEQSAQ